MLPVTVKLHCYVIAELQREQIAGLHRAANAKVLNQINGLKPLCAADVAGRVSGAVVDHNVINLVSGIGGCKICYGVDHAGNIAFLIVSWNNDQNSHETPPCFFKNKQLAEHVIQQYNQK